MIRALPARASGPRRKEIAKRQADELGRFARVEQRILALPDDAMIFCLSFTEEVTGQRFVTNDIVERLAADARVPIFGVHEVQVGHGIVGGRVFSSRSIPMSPGTLAYRPYVIGTLSVIVLQTALIAGLLAQRAPRRRAQGILHASEAALRASNDGARALSPGG